MCLSKENQNNHSYKLYYHILLSYIYHISYYHIIICKILSYLIIFQITVFITFIIFTFSYLLTEKVLFWGQISEMEILMELHVLRSPESENHIFSVWCVCMCVCYQHNSETNNSRIFKFGILYLYHWQMLLETLYKDRTKTLCAGAHKKILIH